MKEDTIWYFTPICLPLDRRFLADALFGASIEMMELQSKRLRIKNEGFEGMVSTDFAAARIGSVSGTLFRAIIETDHGNVEGRFLLPDRSVEAHRERTSSRQMTFN